MTKYELTNNNIGSVVRFEGKAWILFHVFNRKCVLREIDNKLKLKFKVFKKDLEVIEINFITTDYTRLIYDMNNELMEFMKNGESDESRYRGKVYEAIEIVCKLLTDSIVKAVQNGTIDIGYTERIVKCKKCYEKKGVSEWDRMTEKYFGKEKHTMQSAHDKGVYYECICPSCKRVVSSNEIEWLDDTCYICE